MGKCCRFFVLCLCLGSGCAHESGLFAGQPEAPPNLACLPELGSGGPADTRRTHEGLVLTQRALDEDFPLPPVDRSYAALQRWMQDEVAAWIAARTGAASALHAQFGLDGAAAQSERVVGQAALGLLQEDTALDLQTIPPPSELAAEPEIRAMFQDIVATKAEPFLAAALIAFRECADEAYEGPEATAHFAAFCDARFQRLRAEVQRRQSARLQPTTSR